ncbi:hypothetical protein [Streptomyces parvus]|uniref:hypothetical protein n=1 Tax=Streptomyces parvus TaxID=66428 RepID=UPI0021010F88|nr:hypothetical protein [Streptomyces parvus]MCQ1578751.1 hypothetical protein [Streptomyces parvus]
MVLMALRSTADEVGKAGEVSLEEIKEFELALDREMQSRDIFKMSATSVLRNAFGVISVLDSQGVEKNALAATLRRGLDVALPILIKGDGSGREVDVRKALDDLTFLSHYYLLRECLYYSYTSPGSFSWSFEENRVVIEFADPSIPRQFSQGWNVELLDLIELHRQGAENSEIEDLLRGKEEFGDSEHISKAFESILTEAKARASLKFDLLDAVGADTFLKGYTYEGFRQVYEYLLAKALYHRHFARVNSTWPVFQFPKEGLVRELAIGTGLAESDVRAILGDLAYSPGVKHQPMYFSIVDHPGLSEFLMPVESVIGDDIPAQLLRVQAARDPNWFLSHISNPLGDQFVDRLASLFEAAGFLVQKNVSLASIDPKAPDVDLLVVSREETLGYFVFAIEAKATLPAYWAKDYLRVLNRGGLSKAFDQVASVVKVLGSDGGSQLLVERILSMDPEPLDDGRIVLKSLIVTSQNSGMFFEQESSKVSIIDHRTLKQLLRASDGDVVYIGKMLQSVRDSRNPEVSKVKVEVGGLLVAYEVVAGSDPMFFPPNEWKSTGVDAEVARRFFEGGGSRQNPF